MSFVHLVNFDTHELRQHYRTWQACMQIISDFDEGRQVNYTLNIELFPRKRETRKIFNKNDVRTACRN